MCTLDTTWLGVYTTVVVCTPGNITGTKRQANTARAMRSLSRSAVDGVSQGADNMEATHMRIAVIGNGIYIPTRRTSKVKVTRRTWWLGK